jgi:hypothetical protein
MWCKLAFSCLNNFWKGKHIVFKTTFQKKTWTFFFQHYFWHDFWFSCHLLEILHKFRFMCLTFVHSIITKFYLALNIFVTLRTKLGLPHPMIIGLAHDIYSQFKNPMGIHLLSCFHEWECIASHDTIRNAFTFIARNVKFHISC